MNGFTVSLNQNKSMVRHGATNKRKYFLGFSYMRSQAESRYNFEEELGIARRKEKEER
jgi:hypothetical protein